MTKLDHKLKYYIGQFEPCIFPLLKLCLFKKTKSYQILQMCLCHCDMCSLILGRMKATIVILIPYNQYSNKVLIRTRSIGHYIYNSLLV